MHVKKIQYNIESFIRMECKVKTSDCEKRSYESVCLMLCTNETTTIASGTMVAAAVVKTRRSSNWSQRTCMRAFIHYSIYIISWFWFCFRLGNVDTGEFPQTKRRWGWGGIELKQNTFDWHNFHAMWQYVNKYKLIADELIKWNSSVFFLFIFPEAPFGENQKWLAAIWLHAV